ncbi:MAG TPA: DUF1015 family protein, partial [Oligoflexia bacterium]|nr:DUF1015 family protein [Oligoflexia bacterium]
MITITPIAKALVPANSEIAAAFTSPNYDEFQNDREIWEILQRNPVSILAVKMPHCDVADASKMLREGSPEALAHAAEKMQEVRQRPAMKVLENLLYVYEITAPF